MLKCGMLITVLHIKILVFAILCRPTLPIGSEMIGLVRTVQIMYNNPSFVFTKDSRLFGTAVFYALIVLVPCIALAPDVLYKM